MASNVPPIETVRLADGRTFILRALRSDDLEALRRAFRRLTPDEVELRFFHQSKELPAFIEHEVRTLDPERDIAFVLEDAGEIRAVADMHLDRPGGAEAEFGLIVGQRIAGNGLGTLLMRRLLREARRRGVTLRGDVLRDNGRMLDLCQALGGVATADPADPTLLSVEFAPA